MLGVWTHLEGVFVRHSGHNSRMQIARVKTPSKRLVGRLADHSCMNGSFAEILPPFRRLECLVKVGCSTHLYAILQVHCSKG